jgi:hypothetical protein
MSHANALHYPSWYADGLRWIASLFTAAADRLDRMHGASALPLEPAIDPRAIDDYIDDVRFRMSTRY